MLISVRGMTAKSSHPMRGESLSAETGVRPNGRITIKRCGELIRRHADVWFAAAVLMISATAKTVTFKALASAPGVFAGHPDRLTATIAAEWLLVGLLFWFVDRWPQLAWSIATATFAVLLAVSLTLAGKGVTCSCLGSAAPWWSGLAASASVLAMLLYGRKKDRVGLGKVGNPCWKRSRLVLCAVPALGLWTLIEKRAISNHASTVAAYRLPWEQIGERWDFLSQTGAGNTFLAQGRRVVLVVQPGCAHCQAMEAHALGQYAAEQLVRVTPSITAWSVQRRGSDERWEKAAEIDASVGKLVGGAPCLLILQEGSVQSAKRWRER